MKLIEQLQRLDRLDSLIRRKATGAPEQLAHYLPQNPSGTAIFGQANFHRNGLKDNAIQPFFDDSSSFRQRGKAASNCAAAFKKKR